MSAVSVTPTRRLDQDALVIRSPEGSEATVLLYGGHLLSFRTADGQELLYVSPLATAAPGKAVRGGVPVIFPRFDENEAEPGVPRHGFARTRRFEHTATGPDGVRLTLGHGGEAPEDFPPFRLELDLTLGARALTVTMGVHNLGSTAFRMTVALHTYLRVRDIGAVEVRGLHGRRYFDKVTGGPERVESAESVVIRSEVDRIYADVGELELIDAPRKLRITQEGFRDAIVWNPGPAAAAKMSDFPDAGYKEMLCIEAGSVREAVRLEPGAAFRGAQTLSLARR